MYLPGDKRSAFRSNEVKVRTAVVAERVKDSDEAVEARPVVRVTAQAHLEGMTRQWDAHPPQSHLTQLVPHVHISGVQHDSLREIQYTNEHRD